MQLNKQKIIKELPFFLSYLTLFIFLIIYLILGNYEFLFYIGSIILFTILVHFLERKFSFTSLGKYSYFIWLLMHMFGGSLKINGDVLYNKMIFTFISSPYNILKYDQIVHFFCYFTITILLYSIFKKITKKENLTFWVILVLAASSIGAINEIVEFITVILFTETNVGGYYNTCLDLVFNLVGAITAVIFIKKFKK